MMNKYSRIKPIPPGTIVRWKKVNYGSSESTSGVGRIFRVGFYSKQDGLDVIWLVNDDAVYEQTIDHEYLNENFEIIEVSDETDLHGVEREVLKPLKLN